MLSIRNPHIVSVRPPAVRIIRDNPVVFQVMNDAVGAGAVLKRLRSRAAVILAPDEIPAVIFAGRFAEHILTAHLAVV